jgi:hypothetical protein
MDKAEGLEFKATIEEGFEKIDKNEW